MTLDNVEHFTTKIQRSANDDKCILSQAHAIDRDINVVATARRVQASAHVVTTGGGNQPFDIEKQIFARPVITTGSQSVAIESVESDKDRMRFVRGYDALLGKHQGVGIIHFQHVVEEEPFGIFKNIR